VGLGFLPWEKWLPPYIYGPLLFAISVAGLLFERPLRWWFVLLPFSAGLGAWATWVWFKEGRNIFDETTDNSSKTKDGEPRQ
jgi:hypothetical protein